MNCEVVIVGSGFSGICLGIMLKKAGIDSFIIVDKADRLGGTWRDNSYPGAICDVPSVSYSFSFELNPDWNDKWSGHAEILAYMERCTDKYGLGPHMRFGTEIATARFDEQDSLWRLTTSDGQEITTRFLATGTGQLSRPNTPEIARLDEFGGTVFHSARWNHDYDLCDKRIGVIGNAASALQFVPRIAPEAGQLFVFQRSANWVLPRNMRHYSRKTKDRLRRYPVLNRLYRWWVWLMLELRFPLFRRNRVMARMIEGLAKGYIKKTVQCPDLRRVLLPDYPAGAKRILASDDYYQALGRENVDLITTPIERVTADGVTTADGKEYAVDAVILATGFQTTEFLAPMAVHGANGCRLEDVWKEGARAYLGITVPGFPNFFMMYGPNTNLGHNSIIFMIECQASYIVDCIAGVKARRASSIEVKHEVMVRWDARTQKKLARTVWAEAERSWYKRADGRITNNWSGTHTAYWWATRRPTFAHYDFR